MGIDTSTFTGREVTAHGGKRDPKQFWRAWLRKYPETLSPENRALILEEGHSPVVDEQWVRYFPEHAGYLDDTLVHNHLNQGKIAHPVPFRAHNIGPGPAVWNNPDKPPPGWENWTPP